MPKKDINQPISEQIHELKHILKVLAKGQQEIKSHLWGEGTQPSAPSSDKVKQEAINYINSVVVPEIKSASVEQPQGDIAAQGLGDWLVAQLARPVFEYLKTQALEYIGEALSELKKKTIPYAVSMADWILERLEDYVAKYYSEAQKWQQEEFKHSIEQHFPNSRLLTKLN